MSVQVSNLSNLQHKLRGLPESVTKVAVDEIQAEGVRVRDRARAAAPEDSGELRRGIRKVREARGLNAKVHVAGASARGKRFYARFYEFGTKQHIIRPRRKKALAGKGFGPVKQVVHPGQPPRPFLGPAFLEQTRDFPARLGRAISRELRRVGR